MVYLRLWKILFSYQKYNILMEKNVQLGRFNKKVLALVFLCRTKVFTRNEKTKLSKKHCAHKSGYVNTSANCTAS